MTSEWTLEALGQIVTGKTPPKAVQNAYSDSGMPFLTPKDMDGRKWVLTTERCLSEEGTNSVRKSIVPAGSIAVSCIGSDMGKAVRIPVDSVTNQQINTLIPNAEKCDPDYLYYLLSTMQQDLKDIAGGSATPILNKGHFGKVQVQLPDIRHQNQAAKILAALDDKIQLNHQINQTVEQIAQAIFKSWFVDFEPVKAKIATLEAGGSEEDALLAAMQAISGKGEAELTRLQAEQPEQYAELRATAELFPAAMQDSELGEIPEGWRQRQVGELATIKGGKQRSRDLISNIGPVPVFGGAGIMGYTDEHNADGFVISVGRVGAYCGQFFSHRGPSWVNNNASLIRPSNINHGEWLFIALQNIDLAPIKKGAAQPFVSNSDLAKLQVVWPGDMVIEKFTQQLRNLFLLQETLLQQSDSLSTLRDTLLPELLAGRLDTSVIGS